MSTDTNLKEKAAEQPARIEVEAIPFNGTIVSKYASTMELSRLVNNIFKGSLTDYEGCIILPNANGTMLECSLYFKDKPAEGAGQVKNMVLKAASTKGARPVDRITSMNNRISSNAVYTLTDETKQILSDFMFANPKTGKVDWNNCISEQTEGSPMGRIIYMRVTGIDLLKVLKAVYGSKTDDGGRCDYGTSLVKQVGVNNWLVTIQRLDTKDVERLAASLGVVPTTGAIMMVRN